MRVRFVDSYARAFEAEARRQAQASPLPFQPDTDTVDRWHMRPRTWRRRPARALGRDARPDRRWDDDQGSSPESATHELVLYD